MQCIWSTLAKSVTWRNSYRTAGLSCSPVGRTSYVAADLNLYPCSRFLFVEPEYDPTFGRNTCGRLRYPDATHRLQSVIFHPLRPLPGATKHLNSFLAISRNTCLGPNCRVPLLKQYACAHQGKHSISLTLFTTPHSPARNSVLLAFPSAMNAPHSRPLVSPSTSNSNVRFHLV